MGRQRNPQRKEKEDSPEKQLSNTEACNMTDKEFRIRILECINRMEEKIDNLCKKQEETDEKIDNIWKKLEETDEKIDNIWKKLEETDEKINNLSKTQEEMKSDIAAMKNSIESINSRLGEAEDRISELEDKEAKHTQNVLQLEKKIKRQEESLRELWDNMKRNNIRIIGVPEQQKDEQGLENLLEEIISENFPEVGKKKVTQAQRVPNKVNPKRPTPRHIIITMANVQDKERILQAARERRKVTYKGSPIRLSNDFSTETHQARKEWTEIYKVMQSKGLNPRILYPARLSFKLEGEIRSFTDKKRLREFVTTKPAMQGMLKGLV